MDFALILFVLTIVTGVLWIADRYVFRPKRAARAKDPFWVEWGAGFFPVILIVFLLRSFLVEPFRIPSESMMPTLLTGDFILVNKYTYGIRLPVINKKVIEAGSPQRGDVMVFRFPPDPSLNYIKRVIGLPGDKIEYLNKRLTINGQPMPMQPNGSYIDEKKFYYTPRFLETLGNVEHDVLLINEAPPYANPSRIQGYPQREKCQYNSEGFSCEIPAGQYFMMGDNRDNSEDSRYWGFVPDENIVGKAFFIWFNFGDLKRIGSFE
ncbi:MAG: signal peptidase I [Zoogloeaceae bacterium]|jgi:signal peptidase I|nr:signal peptidase I [Zoogloeaceae bacterium]